MIARKPADLEDLIGRTVADVREELVEGEGGAAPCVVLVLDDGTEHGFILESHAA